MTNISFELIKYENLIEEIEDDFLQSLYKNNFSFSIQNASMTIDSLVEFLEKNASFLTYYITKSNKSIIQYFTTKNWNSELSSNFFKIIICIEKKLIVFEDIKFDLITNLILKLKNKGFQMINVQKDFLINEQTEEEKQANEEINNFLSYYYNKITNNNFLQLTIRPVVGYLIRRFYCPSFFSINPKYSQCSKSEDKIKKRLIKAIIASNGLLVIYHLIKLSKLIGKNNENKFKSHISNEKNLIEFKEDDFIILRSSSHNNALFSVVFHKPTFYLYMMKTVDNPKIMETELKHESNFNKHYSHQCMTKCYGYVKKNDDTIGFIYEFMCNSTLFDLVKSKKTFSNNFLLITVNRLFRAIEYLHSNFLVHRDIKPDNILFDNDYLLYLSDFDKIRQPSDEMTENIGSISYSSPEQDREKSVSYPTDIFSFGLIIYYLYENKNLITDYDSKISTIKNSHKIKFSSKISTNIQNLIKSCIKFNPEERIGIQHIKRKLCDETNSFSYLEQYLTQKSINLTELCEYFYENILLCTSSDDYNKFFRNFLVFHLLLFLKQECDDSEIYNQLGCIQKLGLVGDRNILKAKEYFELSAKSGCSDAFYELGCLYSEGNGVEKNYSIAKKYFEISAQENHPFALFNLGYFYEHGLGVDINYHKAINYYELAAKYGFTKAYVNLGNIYSERLGDKNDYSKAIKYYELAAQQNNSNALLNLGLIYYQGKGVIQDYSKARKYFELAYKQNNLEAIKYLSIFYLHGIGGGKKHDEAKKYSEILAQNNSAEGFFNLGFIYENGLGYSVAKDYKRAKYYYEKAAKLNFPLALMHLGYLYKNGLGVKKDLLKAKEYFEECAKWNNSDAFVEIGRLYESNDGIKIDYSIAKKYYELAAELKNPRAYFVLGYFYLNGYGVVKDLLKGKNYLEQSAKFNYPTAFYLLGRFYLEYKSPPDINNSIYHFAKCKDFNDDLIFNYSNQFIFFFGIGNFYKYLSYNELFLIYLLIKNDKEKAIDYLKKAAFEVCSYAKNNYGLILELFQDNKEDAEYFYTEASKANFALADYNLGRLYEEKDKEKSIEYYEKVSLTTEIPLKWGNDVMLDKMLNDSAKVISSLANLKLADYYEESNPERSNEYITKSMLLLKSIEFDINIFNIFMQNDQQTIIAINIPKAIETIEKILFTPPYTILFGRFGIEKIIKEIEQNNINDSKRKEIDQSFHDGFEF